MEKINFEDGELVTPDRVIIDNVEYEITEAEYTGNTPLSAYILNKLQDNIEKAINEAKNINIEALMLEADKRKHPIGSLEFNVSGTNPNNYFGFGTWELWGSGRVPVCVDENDADFDEVEKFGGEKTHTLTTAEMPSHSHVEAIAISGTGAGYAYANMISENNYTNTYSRNENSGLRTYETGEGEAHNNMPPYIACYIWKRVS